MLPMLCGRLLPGQCNAIVWLLAGGVELGAGRGGGRADGDRSRSRWVRKNFLVILQTALQNLLQARSYRSDWRCISSRSRYTARMTFKNLPLTVRTLRATEATLERIYNAAYLGLKEDSLALAAGMLPVEYKRLKEHDHMAEMAELKGRADSELESSQHLLNAARAGDAKAALAILQHAHGWVAKQSVSIEVDQRISVIDALRAAESRVIEGQTAELIESTPLTQTRPARVENQNAKADL